MQSEKATAKQLPSMIFDNRISHELPVFLTCSELAEVLKVSEHTIRAWRKLRKIKPQKFGRSIRWLLEEVLEELSKGRS
jgi:excisionase family DNA binding protein